MPTRTAYVPVAGTAITAANHIKFPGGWIGYAEVTANQGSITSVVDLTSLTLTVTVGASRRVRVSGFASMQCDTANAYMVVSIYESGTQLQSATGSAPTAFLGTTMSPSVVLTPSTGSHTYRLRAQLATSGTATMNASANAPAWILVEDLGPSS